MIMRRQHPYRREADMYPDVCVWLRRFLRDRHKRHRVLVADTSRLRLSNWLESNRLHRFFPDYEAYDIRVDVTGAFYTKRRAALAFVECKLKPIILRDISQLLGYSRVAQPSYSIITSPAYISTPVAHLLCVMERVDVLHYGLADEKRMRVAQWDAERKTIVAATVLPRGEHS